MYRAVTVWDGFKREFTIMTEQNYDFRARHWKYHLPNMRNPLRCQKVDEMLLDASWSLGCAQDAPENVFAALRDFQDYLLISMGLSLPVVRTDRPKTLWLTFDPSLDKGFIIEAAAERIQLNIAEKSSFRAVVYLEDCMNLEGAPVLQLGRTVRKPLYDYRAVHSGCGIDEFPDSELAATVHAGYDVIVLFLKGVDQTAAGYCNVNDLIRRAAKFELKVLVYNYIGTFISPDAPCAQEKFDAAYGDLFNRYPGIIGIFLCGESLEFPSRDPATTGKKHSESYVDGIPDTRPSPGWYPCSDYPAYLKCIEKAVHKYNPNAEIIFETYNWGYQPLDIRSRFLQNVPEGIIIDVCYEIFAQKMLEGLHTPAMDYTVSTEEAGYYFTSECETAHKFGIPLQGNVNTAGIGWDFGTVPYVPVPYRWLKRDRDLRNACQNWGVRNHYATHHYGWWNSVAADLGKWSSWADFEPDYDEILRKIAIRDYGTVAASHVIKAWKLWREAMAHYTASNEDQYGPWRVGPAYPFIFHPNITRTMSDKEIKFPTSPQAHFGWRIIKTFYQPYENENQSPGFLRYPAEIRSLEKMLNLWEQGVDEAQKAADSANGERLLALGHFIRNSIRTTLNIKHWWRLNMVLQNSTNPADAMEILNRIEALAHQEIENARDTIPAVETDSRIGWEPSMEYVCDRWHLEWKIRQVESCLAEIATYRKILQF